jgi:small subunit ribosomal protein S11
MADDTIKAEGQQPPADATAAAATGDGAEATSGATARRERKSRLGAVPVGVAYIRATFNNTSVSITDPRGGVIAWSSAGRAGFKGSRKSTAYAATMVAQDAARQAVARGMHELEVRVQGAGAGRESAIRALQSSGLNVMVIKDATAIPHNGCRARKRRRV